LPLKNSGNAWDLRLKRLAANIEALAAKDEDRIRQSHEILALRREAAAELYAVCAGFVESVNRLLPHPVVHLDPPHAGEWEFRDEGLNLIQINVRGRILQVSFHATSDLLSTEDFRIPYTLEGTIRAFNQDLLDKDLVEEQLLFHTVERRRQMWRFFDPRTHRSGPFDREYLISLMEQVV
jgi:hypothetical protein